MSFKTYEAIHPVFFNQVAYPGHYEIYDKWRRVDDIPDGTEIGYAVMIYYCGCKTILSVVSKLVWTDQQIEESSNYTKRTTYENKKDRKRQVRDLELAIRKERMENTNRESGVWKNRKKIKRKTCKKKMEKANNFKKKVRGNEVENGKSNKSKKSKKGDDRGRRSRQLPKPSGF